MFVLVAYWSFYVKTTLLFCTYQQHRQQKLQQCHWNMLGSLFPLQRHENGTVGKVVAYHLNCNTDSPHPTTGLFFCKADHKLKSNSLFVIHSFNDSYAKCIFMQLDITKHGTLRVYWFSALSMILWLYHHNT